MPSLFEVVPLPIGGTAALEKPTVPYFVAAKQGLYLYKTTAVGHIMLPQKTWPDHFNPITEPGHIPGVFWLDLEPLPAPLVAQVFDFFKRVYEAQQTEAEVLITRKHATGEYRVFVPTQKVTGASVNSIYDPTHIQRGWHVVGSIHSHCNFSAFHSGTDLADASTFNGLHVTIGDVLKDQPSFAAMISLDNNNFDYPIEKIADTSAINSDNAPKAPDFWFKYLTKEAATTAVQSKNISASDRKQFASEWGHNAWSQLDDDEIEEWFRQQYDTENTHQVWNQARIDALTDTEREKQGFTPRSKSTSSIPEASHASPQYGPGLTWCHDIRTYVPSHWQHNGKILPSHVIDVLQDTIADLGKLASEFGIELLYDITDPDSGESFIWDAGDPDILPN